MDPKKPRRIGRTQVFIAGTKVNLADPNTIKWLKASGITRVFCLFPLTPKQFKGLSANMRETFHTMVELYKKKGINPKFIARLSKAGIVTSSLVRNTKSLRSYESFLKEARDVTRKGRNILIQCFAGKHMSGTYAMFYLATGTQMNLGQIREAFCNSGLTGNDLSRIERALKDSKVDIKKVVEKKLAIMKIVAQAKAVQKKRAEDRTSKKRVRKLKRKRLKKKG